MHVDMASVIAGKPGRVNEDFTGAVPTAAVVLDGAGGVTGAADVCRHGVAWYAHRLGGTLLGLLAHPTERPLTDMLAEAIERVSDGHRDTCDLADPASPWATVAILRVTDDGRAEHLVLGDTTVVLDRPGEPLAVTDGREKALAAPHLAALDALDAESEEYRRRYGEAATAMRAARNRPGGYWIAKEDPAAAAEAFTGSYPVADLKGAVLLSNGSSRLVDTFGLTDWSGFLALLAAEGPAGIIDRTRRAEAEREMIRDDASVAHCTELG